MCPQVMKDGCSDGTGSDVGYLVGDLWGVLDASAANGSMRGPRLRKKLEPRR